MSSTRLQYRGDRTLCNDKHIVFAGPRHLTRSDATYVYIRNNNNSIIRISHSEPTKDSCITKWEAEGITVIDVHFVSSG